MAMAHSTRQGAVGHREVPCRAARGASTRGWYRTDSTAGAITRQWRSWRSWLPRGSIGPQRVRARPSVTSRRDRPEHVDNAHPSTARRHGDKDSRAPSGPS
mgnify:CR=1 FL=1